MIQRTFLPSKPIYRSKTVLLAIILILASSFPEIGTIAMIATNGYFVQVVGVLLIITRVYSTKTEIQRKG